MFNRKERKIKRIKEDQNIVCTEAKRYMDMKKDLEANIPLVNDGYTKDHLNSELSMVAGLNEMFETECHKYAEELKQYDQ